MPEALPEFAKVPRGGANKPVPDPEAKMPDDARLVKKATKALVEERVHVVYQLLLQGFPYAVIISRTAGWGLTTRQMQNYIRWARERIEHVAAQVQEKALITMLARHADLRTKLYAVQDYKTILDVDKEDAKLLGLYAAEKILSLDVPWDALSDDQVERIAEGEDLIKVLTDGGHHVG